MFGVETAERRIPVQFEQRSGMNEPLLNQPRFNEPQRNEHGAEITQLRIFRIDVYPPATTWILGEFAAGRRISPKDC